MSDFGPGFQAPAPDDPGARRYSSRQTDSERLCEEWHLRPERWMWLWVTYLTLFAALEELHAASMPLDSVFALALRGALWALSVPLGWTGLVFGKDYQPMFIINAPLWGLMVEILIARWITVRPDPEVEGTARRAIASSKMNPHCEPDVAAVSASLQGAPTCPHR